MKMKICKTLLLCVISTALLLCVFSCSPSVVQGNSDLNNMGYTLLDKDDLYFTKIVVKDQMYYYSCLYKYNLKTKEETLINVEEADNLNEVNSFINLVGDELFFLTNFVYESVLEVSENITKVKKTGVNPSKLFEDSVDCSVMQIVGDTIYYYDDAEQMIYKVNKDGSGRKEICDAAVSSMFVEGNKIYYSEFDFIFSVSVNGGEPEVVFDASELEESFFVNDIAYADNYIYFTDDTDSVIRRIKIGDKDKTAFEVIYETEDYIERFSVYKNKVYFIIDSYGSLENYAILSITPGEKTPRAVVDDKNDFIEISPFSIWNDVIYFYAMPGSDTIMDSDCIWYSVPVTGGKPEPFAPLNVFDDNFIAPGDEIEVETEEEIEE